MSTDEAIAQMFPRMARRRGLLPACVLLLVVSGWAMQPGWAAPRPAVRQRVCHRLDAIRAKFGLPGMTVAVSRGDGPVFEFALGHSAGDRKPIEPGAKFLSGSIGKTFVAATALDLYERGILDLDAPLKILLGSKPWFKDLPNSDSVTLRELLTHSSGWPSHVDLPEFQQAISARIKSCRTCVFTPLEAIEMLDGAKPLFAPGRGFAYSETNYLVAAMAIEAASGKSYYGLLGQRILEPLRLTDIVPSNHNVIPGLVSGRITPDKNYFGLHAAATMSNGSLIYNPAFEWGGGGLAASSGGLVRWARALYTGRALPEPYLQDLYASVSVGQPFIRYGLGVGIRGRGDGVSMGHSGSIPGYRSVMRYYPGPKIALAAQYNSDFDDDDAVFSQVIGTMLGVPANAWSKQPGDSASYGVRCNR
jgi:D-alanyl-D-alanine carboxypeptidase